MFLRARAIQLRHEIRIYMPVMSVAQLVKRASIFVKDPMVGLDQPEEFVFLRAARAGQRLGILLAQPSDAVGIGVHVDHIPRRYDRGKYGDGESHFLASCAIH